MAAGLYDYYTNNKSNEKLIVIQHGTLQSHSLCSGEQLWLCPGFEVDLLHLFL